MTETAEKIFLLPAQIADIVYGDLSEESKEEIRQVDSAEGMIVFHHGAGRYVRNTFKLWDEDNPHTIRALTECRTEAEAASSPFHPDQVSHEILKEVWRKVRDEGTIVMRHTGINAGTPFEGTFEGAHLVYPGTNDLIPAEAPDAQHIRPLPPLPSAEAILEANGLPPKTFESELTDLINRYSLENESDTPDHILAAYMKGALSVFTQAVAARDDFHGAYVPSTRTGPLEPLYTATEAPNVSS